jgi:dihydrofolate synthase/folylpolyglutamate synthase
LKNRTSTDFINKDDIQITNQKNNRLHFVYKDLPYDIPQSGSYQAQNAILAIETIKKILPNIRADEIQRGLNEWIWPGRMQLMGDNIFYDVAHNSSGIKILSEDLKNIYKKKPFGLVVIKNDKIREEILDLFQNSFHDIVISTIESKEILGKNNIKKIKELNRFKFIENLPEALDNFKHKETSAPKVIFGSHYIAKYVYSFFDFSFDNGSI